MGKIIIIDAGHGGRDSGAVGPAGLREKEITLAVALQVADILLGIGVEPQLTRNTDKHFATSVSADLAARTKLANKAGAALFVSVHCNSSTDLSATGTETYHYPNSVAGNRLANYLQRQLVAALGLRDRGVKSENFAVLRETTMPAALVELAFISNPQEEALLRNTAVQQKAAWAIAAGIGEYLGIAVAPPVAGVFVDVPADHWAAEAIERRAKQGIVAGYEDGTFKPDDPPTRAELTVIVDRVLKMLGK